MTPIELIHGLRWADLPAAVQARIELTLLDLIGIAAGGHGTRLSRIIRDHAAEMFGGAAPMIFDHRTASPAGVALAGGMMIDSLDGHDGYNPAKGHIGCPLFPAALSLAHLQGASGVEFLTTLVMGYEFGARASEAQHATVPEFHTSGSWGATTAAAAGARLLGLDTETTRHALGIAEYHGPRSQMMRCIDHPTMVKDGSGWGSMAGVSAVYLARQGFTGAPAVTVEQAPEVWADLGDRWALMQQYFKPYPVCRWAHAPVEAVLSLRAAHGLSPEQVERIEVETFHESVRLAMNDPRLSDEAQYSTSFPAALAMVHGTILPDHLADEALDQPEVKRLSRSMVLRESEYANAAFPLRRFARVTLLLRNGDPLQSDWTTPRWDHTSPPTAAELRSKYHDLADPVLGRDRADAIEAALADLPKTGLAPLTDQLFAPIS
ncbi:MmgE/PrpD family protein [Pseudodonghicola flavimaris]|uniref:MmgE/PrpD family protein n=1 Tax=Pseudodonghicola flavimaris TaxID=3050036 RepID=A0ABT7EUZ9_9RHOB|nr:MmgE/PrpD family protein [Pseudodonghicola flavimaris]MDK3016178.1 MmgE/PrpD family protein [Pseudodonghicola flavimaris]